MTQSAGSVRTRCASEEGDLPFSCISLSNEEEREKWQARFRAAYIRSGSPISFRQGMSVQEVCRLRPLTRIEEASLALALKWLRRPDLEDRRRSYFLNVSQGSLGIECVGLSNCHRLFFRASRLLTKLSAPFSQMGIDLDKLKFKLFGALGLFEAAIKETGEENLLEANRYIALLKDKLHGLSPSLRGDKKSAGEELAKILTQITLAFMREEYLLILIQPLDIQDVLLKREKKQGSFTQALSFLEEMTGEFYSIASASRNMLEDEKRRVCKALLKKDRVLEKALSGEWESLIRSLKSDLLAPLSELKDLELFSFIRDFQLDRMREDVIKGEVLRLISGYRACEEKIERFCSRFSEVFSFDERILPFHQRVLDAFKMVPSQIEQSCPFVSLLPNHFVVFVGRLRDYLLRLSETMGIEREQWEGFLQQYTLTLSSFFPEAPKGCSSQFVAEFNLVLHEMRRLIRVLYETSGSEMRGELFVLARVVNHLEQVFIDMRLFISKEMHDSEGETIKIFMVISEIYLQRIEVLKEKIGEKGNKSLSQLEGGMHRLHEATKAFAGAPPSIESLCGMVTSKSSNIALDSATRAFFESEIAWSLWILKIWNETPLKAHAVSSEKLQMLPPYIRMELTTYVDQLNEEMIRFRRVLQTLEKELTERVASPELDLPSIESCLRQTHRQMVLFDMQGILLEIERVCEAYRASNPDQKEPYNFLIHFFLEEVVFLKDEMEEFYLSSLYWPHIPLRDWAYMERLSSSDNKTLHGTEKGRESNRLSPTAFSEVGIEEKGNKEAPELIMVVGKDAAASPFAPSLQHLLSAFHRLLAEENKLFKERLHEEILGGKFEMKKNALENLGVYLNSLEGWLRAESKSTRFPYLFVEGILVNGALIVEQFLKSLLLPDESTPALLNTHSIAELLEALQPRLQISTLLKEGEIKQFIDMGRLITEGNRHLWNISSFQTYLLRRSVRLSRRALSEERSEEIRRTQQSAKEHLMQTLSSLLKVCGKENLFIFENELPCLSQEKEEELSDLFLEVEPKEEDRQFFQSIEKAVSKIEDVLCKEHERPLHEMLQVRKNSGNVVIKRERLIRKSQNDARFALCGVKEAARELYSPSSAPIFADSLLFKSCLILENVLHGLLATVEIPHSQDPLDHHLWERGEPADRPYFYLHRLFDLLILLEKQLSSEGRTLPVTAEGKRAIREVNSYIGAIHRYWGSLDQGESVKLLKELSLFSDALVLLQKGWSLPWEKEAVLKKRLQETDIRKWPGRILEELSCIRRERLHPLVIELLQASERLLLFQQELMESFAAANSRKPHF